MKKLNYNFNDTKLIDLALTQSGADSVNNNERLEFIGDRVLGLTVAVLLFEMFPNESEGELARRHAVLVSTDTLATVAVELGLDKQLRRGHMTGGRVQHILANAMEAVFGAIYLDGGFNAAQQVISEIWRNIASADLVAPKDSKTALQEFVQKKESGTLPIYEYLEPVGASHSPEFTVSVTALGKTATGQGISKKAASSAAAMALLKILAI
ncbi:MAG TPA: ribonuclease III [Alphaproteobacteria bacterium]|nr:ribonuclease III [Alphaproteobacteria bacterium]